MFAGSRYSGFRHNLALGDTLGDKMDSLKQLSNLFQPLLPLMTARGFTTLKFTENYIRKWAEKFFEA
jgi:hypothetical protein